MQLGGVLISESQIADAVGRLAGRVSRDYDLSRVVLVGAMDGRSVSFGLDALVWRAGGCDDGADAAVRRDGRGEVTVSWLPLRDRIEGRES